MRFKIHPSQPKGFKRLASYLAGETRQLTPDRVNWSFGVNLETTEPEIAAAIMEATAAVNTRCQTPAYHFMVSFDPKDALNGKVNSAIMREIAEELVKRMGLSEYQALVFSHKDRKHPHIHFLVNRIHPETGKALSRHEDGKRLAELCREIARERGLNVARDKARDAERTLVEELGPVTEGDYWRSRRKDFQADQPFSKEQILSLREDLRPVFYRATSWAGLADKLNERGLLIMPKGQGIILTDGRGYMKLSDLHDRNLRLPVLNERYQQDFMDWSNDEFIKFLVSQGRDLPSPPKLDGLSKEQRKQAEDLHEAKVKATRGRKALEHRTDLIGAFDAADSEMRYWMLLRDSFVAAENRVSLEQRRVDRQESIGVKAGGNLSVEEGRMFGAMGKYYVSPEKAHTKWAALEKEKGAALAAEMVFKKPTLLGHTHHSLFSSFDKRLKAQRALDTMLKRRKRWYLAKERLDAVRNKQQGHYQMLRKHLSDYESLKRTVDTTKHWAREGVTNGSMHVLEKIIREKIDLRARAMDRLTPRMFENSRLADARLRQLKKSFRDYNEKKTDRDRQKQLDRDLWER